MLGEEVSPFLFNGNNVKAWKSPLIHVNLR